MADGDDPASFLRPLSTDEFAPPPQSELDLRVIARARDAVRTAAGRYRLRPESLHRASATAAGLRALNAEHGDFYAVPPDAVIDDLHAAQAFRGDEPVIDVQTHFMAPHGARAVPREPLLDMYRAVMPAWWTEMDDLVRFDVGEYVANVFLETEVAVAILTSGPGLDDSRNLFNDELAASRALIERYGGSGRLLNHCVVHADEPREVDAMAGWVETYRPAAWKVYTPGRIGPDGWSSGWMLDDEIHGLPFLERARALGVKRICAHKGISLLVDNGSPRDIGPAARAFPDLDFIVYHSGYEFPHHGAPPEGPYTEETADIGVNRLITSFHGAGLRRGANVFAELGSTWFSVIRRPVEAAHVIGKLIAHLGEDNVIWGSDSIWYGSSQPLIDAFRSFRIPDWMCERFGYAPLTPQVKAKILGRNAARVYGIDLEAVRARMADDDLAWARRLIAEYRRDGFAALR
ncbi:MAG: amidohydrolase family protein [Gammaproteobacteria bacterium]